MYNLLTKKWDLKTKGYCKVVSDIITTYKKKVVRWIWLK